MTRSLLVLPAPAWPLQSLVHPCRCTSFTRGLWGCGRRTAGLGWGQPCQLCKELGISSHFILDCKLSFPFWLLDSYAWCKGCSCPPMLCPEVMVVISFSRNSFRKYRIWSLITLFGIDEVTACRPWAEGPEENLFSNPSRCTWRS